MHLDPFKWDEINPDEKAYLLAYEQLREYEESEQHQEMVTMRFAP